MSRRLALACALVVANACAPCARSAARAPEELVGRAFDAAFVLAPLARLQADRAELLKLVDNVPGLTHRAEELSAATAAQLGGDPLKEPAAFGLDASRGAAVVSFREDGRDAALAVLPIADEAVFTRRSGQLLRERAGFSIETVETLGGQAIRVFARPGDARVAVALCAGKLAAFAFAPEPARAVSEACARTKEQSLATDPRLLAARRDLGDLPVISLVAKDGVRWRGRRLVNELSAGIGLGRAGPQARLLLRARLALDEAQAKRLAELLPGGTDFSAALETALPDAPIRAFAAIAPGTLAVALTLFLGDHADPRVLALAATLPPALGNGVALALDVAPSANLGRALDPAVFRDPLALLSFVRLLAVAPLADPAKVPAALKSIDALGVPGLVADSTPGPTPLAFLALGHTADEARVLLKSASGTASTGAQLAVDFGRIAARIRALPDTAWGVGAQAFVARSLVSQVLEPLSHTRARVALTPIPGGVALEASVATVP